MATLERLKSGDVDVRKYKHEARLTWNQCSDRFWEFKNSFNLFLTCCEWPLVDLQALIAQPAHLARDSTEQTDSFWVREARFDLLWWPYPNVSLSLFLRDSNTWTFFVIFWFQEMNLFFGRKVFSSFKKTQRIDFFCELNLLISWVRRKELKLFFFFSKYHSKNFFLENSQRHWTFWWIWLKELNSFWKCDSKNWTLFEKMTQRIVFFLGVCLK